MGERKVLNKYIPADFDPKLVPRGKKPKDGLIPVRMMLPFTIQCSTCSGFLYRGRKFNSQKEPVGGIDGKYLGIQKYRFYIKCGDCSRPITFLTDPKNADYEMESGGTRNYEVWHDENKTNADFEKQLEEDEKMDSMKALENRVEESQREMAEMDALEEIRAMNQRHVRLMSKGGRKMDAAEAVLKAREAAQQLKMAEEELNENGLTNDEENLVQSIKFGVIAASNDVVDENGRTTANNNNSSSSIRRLDEEDEAFAEKQRRDEADAIMMKQLAAEKRKREEDVDGCSKTKKSGLPVMFKVKRKKKKDSTATTAAPDAKKAKTSDVAVAKNAAPPKDSDSSDSAPGGGALGLLGGYGSTDSD